MLGRNPSLMLKSSCFLIPVLSPVFPLAPHRIAGPLSTSLQKDRRSCVQVPVLVLVLMR